METPLYRIAQAGFLLLTVVYILLLLREFQKALARTSWSDRQKSSYVRIVIAVLLLWAIFVTAWSLSGRMRDFSIFPLNVLPVIVVPAIAAVLFISSSRTSDLLKHIPAENIIRLQSFRFGVEVLLWLLFVADLLPVQMTFEGRNFDIIAGFTAPVIAVLISRNLISRNGIIAWNIIGLALLANIVTIAILSTPSPWRVFMNEPANYIVTWFPISWLPGFLVPLAYYLHFLSIKQVMQSRREP